MTLFPGDQELIQHLFVDAELTSSPEFNPKLGQGIETVFVATDSGLTRVIAQR